MSNLPLGWSISTLGSLSKVITKGTTPTTNGFPYTKSGVKFLRVENISKGGKILENDLKFISEEANSSLSRSQLKEGDLLISIAGAIGRSAIVEKKHLPANTNQAVGIVRLTEGVVENNYIRFSFESPIVDKQITDLQSGLAQINLNLEQLGSLRINLPPLPEQQKIAAILTSVDDVIESTQAQINKLKDLKTGMMQELLIKGIGHTEFKDSPVGRIPKAWEVKELNEVVDPLKPITYGIVQAGPHIENGVPYIRVSDMIGRELKTDGMLRTSLEIAEKFKRSSVNAGDIVYALRGVIGHVQKVPQCLDGANLTQGTARISSSSLVDTNYLLWALKSPYVAFQNDMEAKGSTFREVTLASLRAINVCVPSIEEQNKISAILDGIQNRIDTIEDKYAHFQSIKKALMQDLLTGKVRVKVN